jgi:DNA topoisomerase VI subunit A
VKENLRFPSSELPSTLSSRYLQVENDVKSDILLDRAKKVLKHGMKHSNFHMWSNESSLRVYVPEFDRYMLKSKKTTLHDGKQFQRMLQHLRSIIYLLEHKLYSTIRDFYYTDTELFNNKQVINQLYFSIHVSIFVANCYRIELN